jgi:hypothetical protein
MALPKRRRWARRDPALRPEPEPTDPSGPGATEEVNSEDSGPELIRVACGAPLGATELEWHHDNLEGLLSRLH